MEVNFIQGVIDQDLAEGRYQGVHTRFPPEPNGYLHIGHAKAICLNFGLASENNGWCNLRFDDTNPSREDTEYVDSILEDIRWLGFEWRGEVKYASDYFERLYEFACELIRRGKAYVCELTPDEIRDYRGTLTEPGRPSPWRDRPAEENLKLFDRMRNGDFPDGTMVLRARIDMGSPNLNMRDPVLYRMLRAAHHRTKDDWIVYPMYDYAHPLSDYLEGITHSICTMEYEDHRPLYDWVLEALELRDCPRQIEFARLNMSQTVMSKRLLRSLVEEGKVSGWDDPRMPTICGLRRRGYTPEALRDFCARIGVAKANSTVELGYLEHCAREDLMARTPRVMAVLNPVKVVLTNYPEDRVETLEAELNPEDPGAGTRAVPFARELYIEAEDFMEEPVKKFFRLAPGREVRLKHGYVILCEEVVKDPATGALVEIRCTYDPETKSGTNSQKKVKGTIHWVAAAHALSAKIRLYEPLYTEEQFNPNSMIQLENCKIEPWLGQAKAGERFQFIREGFFSLDRDSGEDGLVFNRIVPLKDSWAKMEKNK
ncbi:MAG: glutamine--tRNA ligase/YqeY domain fusion protein [Peptococcaceae bacterium]|jgi:glutaminyl-tRNA synthetase|nr:glutamine--tRNA ligase/YqeY domain fusion protein [Peptococcaceae bacterium]